MLLKKAAFVAVALCMSVASLHSATVDAGTVNVQDFTDGAEGIESIIDPNHPGDDPDDFLASLAMDTEILGDSTLPAFDGSSVEEPESTHDPKHPDHYDYLGEIRKKSFAHVKHFSLHRHLTRAHPWDQDGGRRLARNAIRLGRGTDEHRKLLSFDLDIEYEAPEAIVQTFDPTQKKISESYRLKVDGYVDQLPFGEGPGVIPEYAEGKREFWMDYYPNGTAVKEEDKFAGHAWESKACPIFDVTTFITAPWTCTFGDSPAAALFDFIAGAGDPALIKQLIDNFLPIITDFLLGDFLGTKVDAVAAEVCQFFGVLDDVKKEVDGIVNAVTGHVTTAINTLTATVNTIKTQVDAAITAALKTAADALTTIAKPIVDTFSSIKTTVCNAIDDITTSHEFCLGAKDPLEVCGTFDIPGANDLKNKIKSNLGCSSRRRLQETSIVPSCSGHMTPCQDLNPPDIDCGQCSEEDDCASKCFVCIQTKPELNGTCISLHDANVHSELISSSKMMFDSIHQLTETLTHRMDTMDTRVQEGIRSAFEGVAGDKDAIAKTIISSMLESEERIKDRTQDAEMFVYDTIHEQCGGDTRGGQADADAYGEGQGKAGGASFEESFIDEVRKSKKYQRAKEAAAEKGMPSDDFDEILGNLFGSMSEPLDMKDEYKEKLKDSKFMGEVGEYIMDAINKKEDNIMIEETTKVFKDRFPLHKGADSERGLLIDINFAQLKIDCESLTKDLGSKINALVKEVLDQIFADDANIELPRFLEQTMTELTEALDTVAEPVNKIQAFIYMIIKQFDPFKADSPLLIPFRLLFRVVQEIASFFMFGCSSTLDPTCKVLPSLQDNLITVSETRDGTLLLNGGCSADFYSEVAFYVQALDFVAPLIVQARGIIPDINIGGSAGAAGVVNGEGNLNIKPYVQIPFHILEWVIAQLTESFNKLTETCDFLDEQTSTDTAVYENTRLALAELACRPLKEGLLKGHGCDGIDNTCDDDKQIDECAEDAFPPEIESSRVKELCGPDKHVFPDIATAISCVEDHVAATDDCYPTLVTVTEITSVTGSKQAATCGGIRQIFVSATEEPGCGKESAVIFDVLVDASASSYCQFPRGPETPPALDISSAIAHCSEKIVFSDINEALSCVELHAKASDVCRDVEVDVLSTGSVGIVEDCGTSTHMVTVTAAIKGCALNTIETMMVLVDPIVKHPSCHVKGSIKTPPALDITKAVSQCSETTIFSSLDGALACIKLHAKASDDCREVEVEAVSTGSVGIVAGCGTVSHQIEVTATVQGCAGLNSTEPLLVLVDPNLEHHSCKFDYGPNLNPTLDISQAVESCGNQIFPSIIEAEDCVRGKIHTEDAVGNCRPVGLAIQTVNVDGLCHHQVTATAKIAGCDGLQSVSAPIDVTIDSTPPVPMCTLVSASIKIVEETGNDIRKFVPFEYHVTDNCQANVRVKVEGFSNEKEDFAEEMIIMYEKPPEGGNTKVGMYVASSICSTKSKCLWDPTIPGKRFYKARVTATDQAGLTGTTECRIEVVHKSKRPSDDSVVPGQYFALSSFYHPEYIPDNVSSGTNNVS